MKKKKYIPKPMPSTEQKHFPNSHTDPFNQTISLSFINENNKQKQQSRDNIPSQNNFFLEKINNQQKQGFDNKYFDIKLNEKKLNYSLKQWLTFGLLKIIPQKSKNIQVDIKSNIIKGQHQQVQQFYKKMQRNKDQMVLEVLQFNIKIPFQDIDIQLQEQWNAKVFNFKLIKKMHQKLQETYKIGQQLNKQIEQIRNKYSKNLTFVRFLLIKKQYCNQAISKIQSIYKKKKNFIRKNQANSFLQISENVCQNKNINFLQNSANLDFLVLKDIKKSQQQEKNHHKPVQQKFQIKICQFTSNSQNKSNKDVQDFQNLLNQINTSRIIPSDQNQNNFYQQKQVQTQSQTIKNIGSNRFILFQQQYSLEQFNKKHFKEWVRKGKLLELQNFQLKDRYCTKEDKEYCLVKYYAQEGCTGQQQFNLNKYFRFQKIIRLQDQETRDAIIKRFVSKESCMQIQYKVIYTQQKYPHDNKLRQKAKIKNKHQIKQQYHENIHHVLFLIGLITETCRVQNNIISFVKSYKQKIGKIIIDLSFIKIKQFIREIEVFQFIKSSIKQYFHKKLQNFKLYKIQRIYKEISVQIQPLNVMQNQMKPLIHNIRQKLQSLICSHNFQQDLQKFSPNIFDDLKSNYLLLQNERGGITLISKEKQYKKDLNKIYKLLKDSQKKK